MQLFRKRVSVIGLDIGASMIKAVKMSLRGKTYFLESYALEPVEEGAIISGEIKNPFTSAQVSRPQAGLGAAGFGPPTGDS